MRPDWPLLSFKLSTFCSSARGRHLFRIVQMACLQGCYSLASRVLQAHMGFSSAIRAGNFASAFESPALRAVSLRSSAPCRLAGVPRREPPHRLRRRRDCRVSDAPASAFGLSLQRAIAHARALYEEVHRLLLAAAHSMPAGLLSAAQPHLQLRATQLAAALLRLLEQVA